MRNSNTVERDSPLKRTTISSIRSPKNMHLKNSLNRKSRKSRTSINSYSRNPRTILDFSSTQVYQSLFLYYFLSFSQTVSQSGIFILIVFHPSTHQTTKQANKQILLLKINNFHWKKNQFIYILCLLFFSPNREVLVPKL